MLHWKEKPLTIIPELSPHYLRYRLVKLQKNFYLSWIKPIYHYSRRLTFHYMVNQSFHNSLPIHQLITRHVVCMNLSYDLFLKVKDYFIQNLVFLQLLKVLNKSFTVVSSSIIQFNLLKINRFCNFFAVKSLNSMVSLLY